MTGSTSQHDRPDDKTLSEKTASVDIGIVELGTESDISGPLSHILSSRHDLVQRRMKQRHVQMIALAGTMGTGLFLGSGKAIREGGPLATLICYATVGTVIYSTLCGLAEMTCFAPVSGSFPHFAERWVDPALGFTLGWNYYYAGALSAPTEIAAACILLTYWDANPAHQAAYTAALTIVVCAINICGVRWFGEAEFGFCLIKLSLITLLIIGGLIIDLGGGPSHERIGFRYWKDPGAVAPAGLVSNPHADRLLAFFKIIVPCAYSFGGMEIIAIGAAETESPRRNVRKAIRRVFWRIIVFYISGVIISGMLVPYNDPTLLADTGTAAESPYVIAITRAGISILPSIINAAIFTSALSAGNSSLYSASRILYGLAVRRQAPRFLTYCTKNGLPIAAILVTAAFAWLSFMNVSKGAVTVFDWLTSLGTTTAFFCYGGMNVTYLRFYKGLKAQNIDRKKFTYYSRFQPFLAYWAIAWLVFFILIVGFAVFFDFTASTFFTDYLSIPIFVIPYFLWKLIKGTKIWRPQEMDFVTNIPSIEETETPEVPPSTFVGRIMEALF